MSYIGSSEVSDLQQVHIGRSSQFYDLLSDSTQKRHPQMPPVMAAELSVRLPWAATYSFL